MQFTLSRRKRPAEAFPVGVDLTLELEAGDTVVNCVATAWDGVTNVSGTIISGAPILGLAQAVVNVQGGVSGKTYRVNLVVTTAGGRVYEHDILIPVLSTA